MFQVSLSYPLRSDWEELDEEFYDYAGRRSDFSGTNGKMRQHRWLIDKFDDAYELRKLLEMFSSIDDEMQGMTVTLREHSTVCC